MSADPPMNRWAIIASSLRDLRVEAGADGFGEFQGVVRFGEEIHVGA